MFKMLYSYMHNVYYKLYTVQCTVYTLYNIQCTLYILQCTFIVQLCHSKIHKRFIKYIFLISLDDLPRQFGWIEFKIGAII